MKLPLTPAARWWCRGQTKLQLSTAISTVPTARKVAAAASHSQTLLCKKYRAQTGLLTTLKMVRSIFSKRLF